MSDQPQPAMLCTADSVIFRGRFVGARGVASGEAVFNTSMTGYQEILTDPSYAGQVVVMTASHIGNYGLTRLDEQASRPAVSGFVMRAMSRRDSNWRSGARDIGERLENGEVQLVINTPRGGRARSDGRAIRRAARSHAVPCVTTIPVGLAVARSLRAGSVAINRPRSLQEWHQTV